MVLTSTNHIRESFYVFYPVVEIGTKEHDLIQKTLSVWYSLAKKLIGQGETVITALYDVESRSFEKMKAASEDELIRTVYELYCHSSADFRVSEEILSKIREETPDVMILHNGKMIQ